ncbi:MAG: zinc-binding dehydrogenase [candidate division WS1 bacterium]|jgi:L-iditol 2-dehydrogenase|nr:zinc-binding dehydrogenase [candidate division WS1 bacterium]
MGNSIPETMMALQLTGVGMDTVELREVEVPRPEADQVLCRVECAAACASDSKIIDQGPEHSLMHGWDPAKWPVTLGHEGCVTPVEVGRNWQDVIEVGRRYAVQPAVPSAPSRYRERYANGGRGIRKIAVGYTLPGLFAEYVIIEPEVIGCSCLLPLPEGDIPHFAAALSEPISCVVAAQQHSFHIIKDSPETPRRAELGMLRGGTTLVLGAGPMGLWHVEIAMSYEPANLIVSEPNDARRETARRFFGERARAAGINLVLTTPDELESVIADLTGGRGVDDCIVALGIRPIQEKSFDYLGEGGVTNLFGGVKADDHMISVDARRIHYESISVVGSSGSDPSDIIETLDMVASGRIQPGNYVSAVGGLDAARDLLQAVREQRMEGKGIIYPSVRKPLEEIDGWSAEQEKKILGG